MNLSAFQFASSVTTVFTVLVSSSQDVCFVGSMSRTMHGGLPRWFLPNGDPCGCTAMRLGGVNVGLQPSVHQHAIGSFSNSTQYIFTEEVEDIKACFKCPVSNTAEPRCQRPAPLGLENGWILSSQMSASSQASATHGPSYARLNNLQGYWVPVINSGSWIEVNLSKMTLLTGVITQGSPFDDGALVTTYKIGYKVSLLYNVYQYQLDAKGKPVEFQIDTMDAKVAETHTFPETIEAILIRIEPLEWHIGVALRFELLGCDIASDD